MVVVGNHSAKTRLSKPQVLPDELESFIDAHSGEGTLYPTPDEFIRSILREKKEREEAAELRTAILTGGQDMLEEHAVAYNGDLSGMLRRVAGG